MTTAAAAATAARRAIGDVIAGRALLAFYFAVLVVALFGSAQGATSLLGWWFWTAFGAVAPPELGGVALSIFADRRRQKGERALAARVLSAVFAGGAVAVQLAGHTGPAGAVTAAGYFFAGFSAAGYAIYLLESAAKRRDALRKAGKLAEPPPVYGAYQWFRHPWLTARARRLAVANAEVRLIERLTSREQDGLDQPTTPLLGRAASLAAARAEIAEERRLAAIGKALERRIAAGVDPTMATIAVNTWDLSKVAAGIAKGADYPALTELLAAELTPARIHAGVTARRTRRVWFTRGDAPQTQEIVAALAPAPARETAETAPETAPETVETDPTPAPAATLPVVPDGARLLPIRCAVSLRPTPEPAPVSPAPPAPQTMETLETAPAGDHVDQVDEDPTPVSPAPALPPIAPHLLPHLAKVMAEHRDWPHGVSLPGRHPDALTYSKIKAATGMTGQQLCFDVKSALQALSYYPQAAEAYVGVHEPATAAA
jgi:hypothetical protein